MVVLYTTNTCSKCKIIERELLTKSINFVIKNIEQEDTLVELVTEGARITSVPILKIKDKLIYDIEEMRQEINEY